MRISSISTCLLLQALIRSIAEATKSSLVGKHTNPGAKTNASQHLQAAALAHINCHLVLQEESQADGSSVTFMQVIALENCHIRVVKFHILYQDKTSSNCAKAPVSTRGSVRLQAMGTPCTDSVQSSRTIECKPYSSNKSKSRHELASG